MKISIAMATYNGAKFLPEQLQSFVKQTQLPDELVVSDDCSNDNTFEIIEQFARVAPFEVRFLRNKKNLGYAGNFNSALVQTSGDLVFLSDQDDVWFPEKISQIVEFAHKYPDKLVYMNNASLTDADLNEIGLTKLGQIYSAGFSDRDFVMGCCAAVRRELLDLCLPIPAGYNAHDKWIVHFADGLDARFICDRVLQYYRRHDNNESKFIANRLAKVNRWSRYKWLLNNSFSADSEADVLAGQRQRQLQLGGFLCAASRNKGRYALQLQSMVAEARAFLVMMEKRIEIRSKPFPCRIFASLLFWLGGGYRNANGLLSFVRDVMGRY